MGYEVPDLCKEFCGQTITNNKAFKTKFWGNDKAGPFFTKKFDDPKKDGEYCSVELRSKARDSIALKSTSSDTMTIGPGAVWKMVHMTTKPADNKGNRDVSFIFSIMRGERMVAVANIDCTAQMSVELFLAEFNKYFKGKGLKLPIPAADHRVDAIEGDRHVTSTPEK